MASVDLRGDFDAAAVRRLAREAEAADQARRLLAIAAVYEGMSRTDAARIGGMDRQTLRDWVHRFNEEGAAGLVNRAAPGNPRHLTPEQEAELAGVVEGGPASAGLGHLARWRCADLKALILERWGVDYHERTIGKLLDRLGFSHITTRPRHYRQDEAAMAAFKKTSPKSWRRSAPARPPERP
jgi:Transposase and inactivated derivatives